MSTISLSSGNFIVTPTGVKKGSKGKVANTAEKIGPVFGSLSKPEARKLRKLMAANGLRGLAAVRRAA